MVVDLEPWRNSRAKQLLVQDIVGGKLDGLRPKEVHGFRLEYKERPYKTFRTNLNTLRKKYKQLENLAQEDHAYLVHDLALGRRQNSRPYPRWQGTIAEKLLKQDIDNGRHLDMPPRELRLTRCEYLRYPGQVFRDHIHQELRARKERPYWMARRKEKAEAKRKQALEKQMRKKQC